MTLIERCSQINRFKSDQSFLYVHRLSREKERRSSAFTNARRHPRGTSVQLRVWLTSCSLRSVRASRSRSTPCFDEVSEKLLNTNLVFGLWRRSYHQSHQSPFPRRGKRRCSEKTPSFSGTFSRHRACSTRMAINHISSGEAVKPTLLLEKRLRPQLKQFLDRLSGFVKSVRVSQLRQPLRCLDFGCGPSVWSALCLAKIADEIVFAEYVTSNRKEVYKWLKHEKGCRDWSVASSLVGDLEKIPARQVEERLRKKSCSVVPCDIHAESIIQRTRKGSQSLCYYTGPDELAKINYDGQTPRRHSRTFSENSADSPRSPSSQNDEFFPDEEDDDLFDIVLSSCCLECACFDELCYRKSVKRLGERTVSGGYLVLVGVMDCPSCGPGRSFPRLSLTADIIKQAVAAADFVVESFETFTVSGLSDTRFYFMVAQKKTLLSVSCKETSL